MRPAIYVGMRRGFPSLGRGWVILNQAMYGRVKEFDGTCP